MGVWGIGNQLFKLNSHHRLIYLMDVREVILGTLKKRCTSDLGSLRYWDSAADVWFHSSDNKYTWDKRAEGHQEGKYSGLGISGSQVVYGITIWDAGNWTTVDDMQVKSPQLISQLVIPRFNKKAFIQSVYTLRNRGGIVSEAGTQRCRTQISGTIDVVAAEYVPRGSWSHITGNQENDRI